VFAQRFFTNIDWNTSFALPSLLQGTWNLTPSVQLLNVDPSAGLIVRTELSGGRYVSQSKRLQYGVGIAPALYGLFPGFGPVETFRHSLNPSLSYSVSPGADVSDEFLQATGRTRPGYLGSLPRNALSLSFATTLEAKLKPKAEANAGGTGGGTGGGAGLGGGATDADAGGEGALGETPALRAGDDASAPRAAARAPEGQKIRLLALNFSSLTYDFIRADTASSGLVEQNFRISARTDLLPNLDFQMGYELFQGDPLSDTALFKPFRNSLGVNFSLDGQSGLVALVGRLFGRGGDIEAADAADSATLARRSDFSTGGGMRDAAGAGARGAPVSLAGSGQGWQLSLTYNANRQRPPVGGTQIQFDPAVACQSFIPGTVNYENCILQATTSPPAGFEPQGVTTPGGPQFIRPPEQNVSGNLSFGLTPNWSSTLSAQYDIERSDFGSLQIGLQRELHDWNAVFSFARAPNGNFSFNFFIALKASPEIKFNYDRRSVR
jgi:hypothetical protein